MQSSFVIRPIEMLQVIQQKPDDGEFLNYRQVGDRQNFCFSSTGNRVFADTLRTMCDYSINLPF